MLSRSTKDAGLCKRRDFGFALRVRWIVTWLPGIIHTCICIIIYTVISQDTSLENTPTSHAVSLALFMHACSDSANMFLCHALAYANGFCLHLLLVHDGVKKVNCMQLQGFRIVSHTFAFTSVRHNYEKYIHIYGYTTRITQLKSSSGYSSFSALAHLLNKYTSCCHDGGRSYTIAISTFRFLYTSLNFPILVAYSCICFIFAHA